MEHQHNGMENERHGDIETAILCYEDAVSAGRSLSRMKIQNWLYSAIRLTVLYRKVQDYDKEIALIESLLDEDDLMEKDRAKMELRLEKALLLKERKDERDSVYNEKMLAEVKHAYKETLKNAKSTQIDIAQNSLTKVFELVENTKPMLKETENTKNIIKDLDEIYYHVENNISNLLQGENLEEYTF